MANLTKQVTVAFEETMEEFGDNLVISKAFNTYNVGDQLLERGADTIWRPMPYQMPAFNGMDQTANLAASAGVTQLSIPASIGFQKVGLFQLSANELRDPQQVKKIMKGVMTRLESEINIACSDLAALSGTAVVKRTVAATGYDDISLADALFNEQGIPMNGRLMGLTSKDYNAMAGTIGKPQTSGLQKTATAFEKAYLGPVSGFDTYKLDYGYSLAAATATGVTVNGANQRYVPVSTVTNANGTQNVDNRYQNLTVTVGGSTIKVGDCFTIAGVFAVHQITKQSTGNLRTFRVNAIVSGGGGSGVIQISPPIIAADSSPTFAETQYQNVTAAPAAAAAITFLNTVTTQVNPFWQDDTFEILPTQVMPMVGAGLARASATSAQGITVVLTEQAKIADLTTQFRADVRFGVVNKQPQQSGIILFSQT